MWQPGWEGSLGKNGYIICMAESLCCPPVIITTLLLGSTLIQNNFFQKRVIKMLSVRLDGSHSLFYLDKLLNFKKSIVIEIYI